GAAPGGPEIQHDDLALAFSQSEPRAVQKRNNEVGGGLADQGRRVTVSAPWRAVVALGLNRLGSMLELPLTVGQERRRLLDTASEEDLVDFADPDGACADHVTLARDRAVLNQLGVERDADAIVADGLNARRPGCDRGFPGRIELFRMEPDD